MYDIPMSKIEALERIASRYLRNCCESGRKNHGSRKWSAQKSMEDAESRVRMKDLIGTVSQGLKGPEVTDRTRWSEKKCQRKNRFGTA